MGLPAAPAGYARLRLFEPPRRPPNPLHADPPFLVPRSRLASQEHQIALTCMRRRGDYPSPGEMSIPQIVCPQNCLPGGIRPLKYASRLFDPRPRDFNPAPRLKTLE